VSISRRFSAQLAGDHAGAASLGVVTAAVAATVIPDSGRAVG
jgi:hypothetical protein